MALEAQDLQVLPDPGKAIPKALDVITGGGIVKDKPTGEDEVYEVTGDLQDGTLKAKTTGAMAEQSIEAQKTPILNKDEFFSAIQNGRIGGVGPFNSNQLNNMVIAASPDSTASTEVRARATDKLNNAFTFYSERLANQPTTEVAFGQETAPGEFTFVPTPEATQNAKLKTVQENIFEGKAAIARVVSGAFEPLTSLEAKDKKRVENIIIRQLSTGSFWNTTVERVKEGVLRGTAIYLPDYAVNYGVDAIKAATKATAYNVGKFFGLTDNSAPFVESWERSAQDRARTSEWWKSFIGDATGIRELSEVINSSIVSTLQQQVDSGEITEDDFKRITKSTVQTPAGDSVELDTVFLDENMAQALLNESVDQLAPSAQYASVLAEAVLTMGGVGKAKQARGQSLVSDVSRKILDINRKSKGDKASPADIELAAELNALDGNIMAQAKFLENKKMIKKVNLNNMAYAMEMDRVDANTQKIFGRLDEVSENLFSLRKGNTGDQLKIVKQSTKYKKLQAEQQRLRGMMVRRYLSGRFVSNVKDNFVEAVPVSLAMYYGGNMTAEGGEGSFFQGDRFAGEGIAAVVYMAIGKPTTVFAGKSASWLNQQMGDVYGKSLEAVEGIAGIPLSLITGNRDAFRGFLTDGSINNFEKATGVALDGDTRRSLGFVAKLAGKLDEDGIDQVVTSMEKHQRRLTEILDEFPAKQRPQVRKILQEDIATMSGIGWLQSAKKLASFKIDARESGSLATVNEQLKAQNLIQERTYATDRMIMRLEELVSGRTDLDDTSEIKNYIKSLKATNNKIMQDLGTDREKLMADVRRYKQEILVDPNAELPPRILQSLDELEVELELQIRRNPDGSAGDIDLLEIAERQYLENMQALASRAEGLELLRNNEPSHLKQVARNLEMMTEQRFERMRKKAKAPFVKLDAEAKRLGKTVPINNMITELMNFAPEGASLKDFFSKGSRFFAGPLGRRMYTVANKMAQRSLQSMEGTDYDNLYRLATTKGSEAYIGDNPRPLDIMLYYMERGEAPDFLATPGEVMDVYSAFRDFGIRTRDEALAARYTDYSGKVEKLIDDTIPEFSKQWKKARNTYQAEWFDKIRGGGPLSDIHKSRGHPLATSQSRIDSNNADTVFFDDVSVGEEVAETQAMKDGLFQMNYRGKTPFEMFDPITDNLNKALRGDEDAVGKIMLQRDKLIRELSDIPEGGVFDLTNEQSLTHFNLIRNTLTEVIYAKWGSNLAKQLGERADLDLKAIQSGGYDFSKIENVSELQELMTVTVKSADETGKVTFRKIKLVDFDIMIEQERGIEKLVRNSNELASGMQQYQKRISDGIETLARKIDSDSQIRTAAQDMVNDALGVKNVERFFEDVVLSGNRQDIEELRETVVAKLGNKFTVGDQTFDTEEVFDTGMKNQIINGLLNHGGLQYVEGRKFIAANGKEYTKKVLRNPENISGALDSDRVRDTLSLYLDDQHIDFLVNITDYLSDQKAIEAVGALDTTVKIDNIVNAMGTNQLIARSFNLARGMVSPQYVAAEFGVSLAQQAGLDLMKLAAGNKEAADLMLQMIKFPKQMTKADLDTFDNLVQDFLISELGALGEAGRVALEEMELDMSEDRD